MKGVADFFYSTPNKARAFNWIKLISITGGAQLIVQLVGLVCGIIVIRLLPTDEYGYYTLANTMMGTMTVLADGGISSGVMAQGGKVWNDKEKLGSVLATGLDLRRKFAIGSLIISTPILVYLLFHNGASITTILLIVGSLVPAFLAALSDSILEIVPKLHQSILPLQKNQVAVGVWRLLLSAITLFFFPWVFVAILATGIPRIYGNLKLRKIAAEHANLHQKADLEVRADILSIVKRILPGAVYYALSGQITIWLISVFGNVKDLAKVGALGRLAVVINLIGVLISVLIQPRFARLKPNKGILLNKFILIQLGLILVSVFLTLAAYLYPNEILFVLGPQYMNLKDELFLIVISSCLSMLSGSVFQLSSCRGIVPAPIPFIAFMIIAQVGIILLLDLNSLTNILMFSIFTFLLAWVIRSGYLFYKIFSIK